MKKLTLDLDRLRVESFEASPADRAGRGTIKGYYSDFDCLEEPNAVGLGGAKPSDRHLNTCDWRCEKTIVVGPC